MERSCTLSSSLRSGSSSRSQSQPPSVIFQNYSMLGPPTLRILETRLDDDGGHEEVYQDETYPNKNPQQLPESIDQRQPNHYFNNSDEKETYEPKAECKPFIVDPDEIIMTLPRPMYHNHYEQEVGIYGWRKKILYILLAVNIVFVGINFALTFWIISVLGFSSNGIGGIDLWSSAGEPKLADQIRFKGSALFQKSLFASEIQSYPPDQLLKFTSKNGDMTFRSIWSSSNNSNYDNRSIMDQIPTSETKMVLTKDKIILVTDSFEIYDRKNRLMFALDSFDQPKTLVNQSKDLRLKHLPESSKSSLFNPVQQLTLRTNGIKINNINSLTLPISLQTTLVDNSINDELRLFSPQGRLLLRGPKSVHLESKLGDVSIVTFNDLILRSNVGKITLDTDSIYIRRLMTMGTTNKNSVNNQTSSTIITDYHRRIMDELVSKPQVYQLCICSNTGRLFLAKADSFCLINSYRDCR